jgi:hypothetical protein
LLKPPLRPKHIRVGPHVRVYEWVS